MIDNPNPRNFYSADEMNSREAYIPKCKQELLEKLKDLQNKIESEQPFPHGNIDIDKLVEFSDAIEDVLNNWNY